MISCSKEKTTEKRLIKRDGVWKIDQIEYVYVFEGVDSTIEIDADIGTVYNAGTVTFTENTAHFKYTINSNEYDVRFKYYVLEDGTFIVNQIDNSFFSSLLGGIFSGDIDNIYEDFDMEQSVILYTGELENRKTGEIVGAETRQYVSTSVIDIEQEIFTATFQISR